MRNSAAYVGRVGGLAVALGIGTAVATGQGLALADSPNGASGPTSNESSQSKSESPDAGPQAGPGGSTAPDKGVVHSTGGAQTGSDPSTSVKNDPDDPSASNPVSGSEAGTTGPDETGPAISVEPTGTPPTGQPDADLTGSAEPGPQSARHSTSTPHVSSQPDSKPAWDVKAQPRTSGITGTANSVGQPAVDTTISTADAKLQAVEPELARTTANSALTMATLSTPESKPVIAEAAATQQATTMTAPRIVTGLLTATFGLGPLATTDPLAPAAPPPTLLGLLEWIRREINRTFFNESPLGITYNPGANSLVNGHIVGTLTPDDPDSTAFTFTATKPAHGEVEVSPNGTFVYTPDATYTGEDFFDVTVSDASSGFHIHGLSGLLNVVTFGLLGESGHTYTRTISVSGDVPPGGFSVSTVVSGLNQPTDFRFLPDNRILIAEKGGAIKVYNGSQLQSEPLITLPTSTEWARGVNGIEVDPYFADNGYVYVSYITDDNVQRLSRITVTDPSADVLTADPLSEVTLVEGDQLAGDDHHGGGLSFGPDDMLYWSTGDNVCCSVLDGSNSQDLTNMYGKVLRLDVRNLNADGTATAPEDNPFYDGEPLPGDGPNNYDAIYATGFRNPFRLTFTPDGELLVVDVGQATWEEVNLVTAGENYGWPNAEGPCNGIGTTSCSTPSSYANPIYAYRHTTGGNSITAVMVYAGSTSGSGLNTVLIADFNQGWIKELTFNSDYSSLISERLFDDAAAGSTNQLAQDPDGNIYQLTFDGTLSRISPSSDVLSTV